MKPHQSNDLFHAFQAEQQRRELVDRLRDIGLTDYIELPEIVVMGDTSSGKSSLLSALSGVTFPSSDELTTRCPTRLILSQSSQPFKGNVRLHRVHSKTNEYEDTIATMDEVPHAIEKLTKILVSEGESISDDEIVLELSGPEFPNLTLTDLPGLVRTVGDGEDHGMIERIRAMVLRYMSQSRTIIIAVVPANVDMHNIEILQRAQEADPEGVRTIAVVTKLDLVDEGAERAVDELLRNRKKRMTLGYHAVKCRSQKDLNEGVTIADGRRREQDFFRGHSYWSKLPQSLWGVDTLTKRLVDVLQSNIRRSLPAVVREIGEQIGQTREALNAMGSSFESAGERRRVFCDAVDRFLRPLSATLKGDYDSLATADLVDAEGVDLRLRAQIRRCDEDFCARIKATKNATPGMEGKDKDKVRSGDYVSITSPMDGLTKTYRVQHVNENEEVLCPSYGDEWLGKSRYTPDKLNHLRRYIMQNRGDELPIFPPYSVFCSILRQWVDMWEQPSLDLVSEYVKLTQAVTTRFANELAVVPRVQEYFKDRVREALNDLREQGENELQRQLTSERRPYTQDPALTAVFTDMLRPGLEKLLNERLQVRDDGCVPFADLLTVLTDLSRSNDEHDTVVMDCGLRAYIQSAITRYVDVVPMRLNEIILKGFVDRIKAELLSTTDDKLERLLSESEATRSRRQGLIEKLETLRQAKAEIEDV